MPTNKYYQKKTAESLAELANASEPEKIQHGVEEAFDMYAQFCGDIPRTAAALNITPAAVIDMAAAHGWNERLKDIFELKKSGKPGDIERALNRAMNFVIANQYRAVLHRLVKYFSRLTDEGLIKEVSVVRYDKEGNEVSSSFNSKAMADLATAIEKMNTCTYVALNDSVTERGNKKDHGENEITLTSIHQVISQSIADSQNSAKREEFAERLAQAQKALSS